LGRDGCVGLLRLLGRFGLRRLSLGRLWIGVFGVSAKAVPETRNNDSVSAANFFISSLFGAKFDLVRKRMRTTPRQKVNVPSYNCVN